MQVFKCKMFAKKFFTEKCKKLNKDYGNLPNAWFCVKSLEENGESPSGLLKGYALLNFAVYY